MELSQAQYYALHDWALGEGDPVLLLGPLERLPSGVPSKWADILTAQDARRAAVALWAPVANRLPRICHALSQRLIGVAYLSTDEVPASLLYFFRDGDDYFEYRGRSPLTQPALAAVPPDLTDLYALHNGWTLYYAEDLGPAPFEDWVSPTDLDLEIDWRFPPGDMALGPLRIFYREADDLFIAHDPSRSPTLPVLLHGDGSVDLLLDPWEAMDREIGEFLESLDPAEPDPVLSLPVPQETDLTPRFAQFSARFRGHKTLATHLGAESLHRQTAGFLLSRAHSASQTQGARDKVIQDYQQALAQWCTAAEIAGNIQPSAIIGMFGLCQVLDDGSSAQFVATIPPALWDDQSIAALQTRVFICLHLGDPIQAGLYLDELLGMTFDGEQTPDREDAICAHLLKALTHQDRADYAKWRGAALAELGDKRRDTNPMDVPWSVRISGFDALAVRSHLIKNRSFSITGGGS